MKILIKKSGEIRARCLAAPRHGLVAHGRECIQIKEEKKIIKQISRQKIWKEKSDPKNLEKNKK